VSDKGDRPSLRDFDYFGERAPANPSELAGRIDVPEQLSDRALGIVRERRRYLRLSVLATAFFVSAAYFVWGYRDLIAYAFASPRPPRQLGDVVGLRPGDIPHNSYVELSGITEHRGLAQQLVRGLALSRDEHWYFRLVGSQGIFIEVPPDPERYGRTTEVLVSGRAIDPRRVGVYDTFVAQYHQRWHAEERPELRIIQVDVRPGEGRKPFVILFVVILGLGSANAWTLWRYAQARRRAPSGFVQ
jgi:hypothetical protein